MRGRRKPDCPAKHNYQIMLRAMTMKFTLRPLFDIVPPCASHNVSCKGNAQFGCDDCSAPRNGFEPPVEGPHEVPVALATFSIAEEAANAAIGAPRRQLQSKKASQRACGCADDVHGSLQFVCFTGYKDFATKGRLWQSRSSHYSSTKRRLRCRLQVHSCRLYMIRKQLNRNSKHCVLHDSLKECAPPSEWPQM